MVCVELFQEIREDSTTFPDADSVFGVCEGRGCSHWVSRQVLWRLEIFEGKSLNLKIRLNINHGLIYWTGNRFGDVIENLSHPCSRPVSDLWPLSCVALG